MKKNNKRESIIIAVILLVVLAVAFYLDAKLPSSTALRVCFPSVRRASCSLAHMPMPF